MTNCILKDNYKQFVKKVIKDWRINKLDILLNINWNLIKCLTANHKDLQLKQQNHKKKLY